MDSLTFSLTFVIFFAVTLGLRLWLASRQLRHVVAHRAQVPAEFAGPEARCGAILIWTSQPGLSHHRRVAPGPRR